MQSKRITKIISLILSVCFAFSCFAGTTAFATDTSSLQSKKSKIQKQIDEAEEKVEKLASEKKETQEYIAALDKKIQLKQDQLDVLEADANALQSEINSIENSILKTEDEIEKTQKEIDKKQAQFDKTFEEYCQRLKAMYVSGHASNLEVLLTCSDFSSVLTRSQMIKSVSEQDSETLDSLMAQMEQIEKDKAALEAKINKLDKDKKKLEEDKKELTNRISTIEASKRELDEEVAECNALIKKLSSQSAEYMESIEEDKSALAKVEAEIQAAYARASHSGSLSGSTGNGAHSGALGYPTSYRSISAGYPNYSSGRYHGGVDFPCPTGTSVHAAASGTVIVARPLYYSYGHHIIIDHGNGLSTLYAHNSALLVSVGQHVSKGQVIARSGSTGNSTGPHCHFEVRVNGTRVNPLNYL